MFTNPPFGAKVKVDRNILYDESGQLNFKLGQDAPNYKDLITDSKIKSWSDTFGTLSKFGSAHKIVTGNPISLAKLNIDAIVVDEIHNFNFPNQVSWFD